MINILYILLQIVLYMALLYVLAGILFVIRHDMAEYQRRKRQKPSITLRQFLKLSCEQCGTPWFESNCRYCVEHRSHRGRLFSLLYLLADYTGKILVWPFALLVDFIFKGEG